MRHRITSSVTLTRDGQPIGTPADEAAALELALEDADALKVDAEYEITKAVKVIIQRRITGPDAPALGPVLTISSTALTLTLDRPASGPTRIDRYEIERYNGSAWVQIASGLSIFSAANEYPDTGLTASTAYQYRCRAVDTTERVSVYSYSTGTTGAGASNTAPVWQSGTIALSVQAGSSVSLTPYCSDPQGDQITYTLLDTNPNDATISVTGSGILQTTAATTVGANSVIVRASDGALTANKTIALTVTAASTGQTFMILAGTAIYNASAVQPGDTIVIEGDVSGNRGPLKIVNANGTSGSRITVRNPTTKAVSIGETATATFVWEFDGCSYLIVDGSYYSGATYGLKATVPSASSASNALIKYTNFCHHITIRYFAVDAKRTTWTTTGLPIGVQGHHNTYTRAAHPGEWFEGHVFEHFDVRNCAGEGLYVGANFSTGALPMRDITVRYGNIENCGRDGIQVKGWWEGTNVIHDLTISNVGLHTADPESGQLFGISVLSGMADVYNNVITNTGESGIQCYVQNGPTTTGSYTGYTTPTEFVCHVYNNVVTGAGQMDAANSNVGHGITVGADSTANVVKVKPYIFSNTIVNNNNDAGAYGVITNANTLAGFVKNNIVLGNSNTISASGHTVANNLTTGTVSGTFVAPELGNYRLKAEQAAVGTIGTDYSSTDIEGTSRAGTASKGAYEYA